MLDILKVKAIAGLLVKREQKEANGLLMLATNIAKNLHSFLGMQLLKIKKTAKATNKIVSDLKQNIASKNIYPSELSLGSFQLLNT